jgi:hypothetical protein
MSVVTTTGRFGRVAGLALGAGLLAAACGGTAQTAAPQTTRPSGSGVPVTVALSGLPEALTTESPPPPPTVAPPASSAPASTTTTAVSMPLEPGSASLDRGAAGRLVADNRLLVIGDSIVASTAPRFGGIMCTVLNDFGWSVEIDAETGAFVEFGSELLDSRDEAGADNFDAAVVMLGNNFRGDYDAFTVAFDQLLDRLEPRPTVIFTLAERDPEHIRINTFLRWRSYFHPNVYVVDWARYTAAEPEVLLQGDGLHLTDEGRNRLVLFTADALGQVADPAGEAECVDNSVGQPAT